MMGRCVVGRTDTQTAKWPLCGASVCNQHQKWRHETEKWEWRSAAVWPTTSPAPTVQSDASGVLLLLKEKPSQQDFLQFCHLHLLTYTHTYTWHLLSRLCQFFSPKFCSALNSWGSSGLDSWLRTPWTCFTFTIHIFLMVLISRITPQQEKDDRRDQRWANCLTGFISKGREIWLEHGRWMECVVTHLIGKLNM